MLHAIVRRPAPSIATACELTHIARSPIDFGRIAQQHAAYCAALATAGVQVTVLDAVPDLPDSVFVEDAAVLLDEVAILARPGAASRRAEPALLARRLRSQYPLLDRIVAPATLDGGDVLRIGRTLYVGQTTRSNTAGIAQLQSMSARFGYRVLAVPVHGSLHLKTACTALDDSTLLLNPDWLDPASMGAFRCIHTAPNEPFAANVLRLNDRLIVNTAAPATVDRIATHAQAHGIRCIGVDIGEFGKAEAGLTCLSLIGDVST